MALRIGDEFALDWAKASLTGRISLLFRLWLSPDVTTGPNDLTDQVELALTPTEMGSYRLRIGQFSLKARNSYWQRLSFPISLLMLSYRYGAEQRRVKPFLDIDIGLFNDPLYVKALTSRAVLPLFKSRRKTMVNLLEDLNFAEKADTNQRFKTNGKKKAFLYVGAMPFSRSPSGYNLRTEQICTYLSKHGITSCQLYMGYYGMLEGEVAKGASKVSFEANLEVEDDLKVLIDESVEKIIKEAERNEVLFIVAGSNWLNGYCAWRGAKQIGIPFIYDARGLWHYTRSYLNPSFEKTWSYAFQDKAEFAVMKTADHVFAISEVFKDISVSQGVVPTKVSVVPNMVKPDIMPIIEKTSIESVYSIRKGIIGKKSDSILLAYAGSITAYENLELIIKVLKAAQETLPSKTLKFAIAGKGEHQIFLENLAYKLGVSDNIIWLGTLNKAQLYSFIQAADIMVYPRAKHKTFQIVPPLKPLEPMLLGTVCMMSNLRPHRELAGLENERGIILKSEDPHMWLDTILKVSADKSAYHAMIEQAKKWVLETRSPETVMMPWLTLIERFHHD